MDQITPNTFCFNFSFTQITTSSFYFLIFHSIQSRTLAIPLLFAIRWSCSQSPPSKDAPKRPTLQNPRPLRRYSTPLNLSMSLSSASSCGQNSFRQRRHWQLQPIHGAGISNTNLHGQILRIPQILNVARPATLPFESRWGGTLARGGDSGDEYNLGGGWMQRREGAKGESHSTRLWAILSERNKLIKAITDIIKCTDD